MFKMKKKVLKKIIVALCAAAMSVPAAASVGAVNDKPNNANHQNQNMVSDVSIRSAQSLISHFLDKIDQRTLNERVYNSLDNEAIETSESLQRLSELLDNINNFDDLNDEEMSVPLLKASVEEFNRYMNNYTLAGPIDKKKLDNIKKRADLILAVYANSDDIDRYEEDYDLRFVFRPRF